MKHDSYVARYMMPAGYPLPTAILRNYERASVNLLAIGMSIPAEV